ncbi:fluoride efflux transporter CrcB [Gordonia jacobaea]|uniref:fluoride efflux transporter CrcB n=1 Tax=Gordonia jacobaea TaxID=122202 RepID=UPI003A4DBBE1
MPTSWRGSRNRSGSDIADIDPDAPADRPLHLQFGAIALVFLGGICGTGLRYAIEEAFPTVGTGWPWATFAINISGAFVLGALLGFLALVGPDDGWRRNVRVFAGTGLCGAFTTYSTFALETTQLGHHGAPAAAVAYAVLSVVLGVLGAWAGIVVAGVAGRRNAVRRGGVS